MDLVDNNGQGTLNAPVPGCRTELKLHSASNCILMLFGVVSSTATCAGCHCISTWDMDSGQRFQCGHCDLSKASLLDRYQSPDGCVLFSRSHFLTTVGLRLRKVGVDLDPVMLECIPCFCHVIEYDTDKLLEVYTYERVPYCVLRPCPRQKTKMSSLRSVTNKS